MHYIVALFIKQVVRLVYGHFSRRLVTDCPLAGIGLPQHKNPSLPIGQGGA